jgi:uncharacterized protein YqjF (DUF2071 family)
MEKARIFLTAEWMNLLMLNYAVDPALLLPLVPSGTDLDSFAGCTYVSLIGFEFKETRILGFSVPFHTSFLEVNLRFYVRRNEKRGVAFISELVPRRAVAAIARWIFNENYSSVPMAHSIRQDSIGCGIDAEYSWGVGPRRCSMRMATKGNAQLPEDGSLAQFITEHYWGYAAQRDGGSIEYEVEHPRWRVWQAATAEFNGESSTYYGPDFSRILSRPPDSAFLADGSAVTVSKGIRIH